ncbi:MAG: hypothetical protein ACPL8I_04325 [Chloroflexaceae bacterium]
MAEAPTESSFVMPDASHNQRTPQAREGFQRMSWRSAARGAPLPQTG